MSMQEDKDADVGVIVGRFQTHHIHDGHAELIETIRDRHDKVIIFLGRRAGVKLSKQDPLDFITRKSMIQAIYPDITVLPITDMRSDEEWSRELDKKIDEVAEGLSVLLYGSRDSFVGHYTGKFPVIQLKASFKISGTEVRKRAANKVVDQGAFRQGIIYAAHNRWPTSYQAVDAACVKMSSTKPEQLLLGRKNSDPEGKWRFIGGFVSPNQDESLETAASRELHEEAPGISVHPNPTYIGSTVIDDWRYAGDDDSLMTAFFCFEYFSGDVRPGDDIDELRWFPLTSKTAVTDCIVPEHMPLAEMFTNKYL